MPDIFNDRNETAAQVNSSTLQAYYDQLALWQKVPDKAAHPGYLPGQAPAENIEAKTEVSAPEPKPVLKSVKTTKTASPPKEPKQAS